MAGRRKVERKSVIAYNGESYSAIHPVSKYWKQGAVILAETAPVHGTGVKGRRIPSLLSVTDGCIREVHLYRVPPASLS